MSGPIPNGRVVIVAANASTTMGGEAILPLHYFRVLKRRGADVHLVAHERNRGDLARYFDGDLAGIHLVEDTWLHKAIDRVGRRRSSWFMHMLVYNVAYVWNEVVQRRRVRELVAQAGAGVVHLPTPVSPRAVSVMSGLGAPTVFGPMNGGMTYPPGYGSHEGSFGRLAVRLGRGAARVANLLLPAKRRAARLVVANARTEAALPFAAPGRVTQVVENGVQAEMWRRSSAVVPAPDPDGAFRLVFVGRLVAFKAVDVTLAALADARARGLKVSLAVVGSGPEGERLRGIAQALGLGDAATFHAFMPQTEVAGMLAEADAFVFNSLRDCGGAAVLEARASGLPVIASAWGGPLDYLDEASGILVHPSPADTFARRLADAIEALARDRERARRMGRAGRDRVLAEFDWERKVDRMVAIYDEARTPTPASAAARTVRA